MAKWTGLSILTLAALAFVAAMCVAAYLIAHSVAFNAGWSWKKSIGILDLVYPSRHSCEEHPERDNDPELCWPPHPRR